MSKTCVSNDDTRKRNLEGYGLKIKNFRKRKKMSADDLAQALQVSVSSVRNWECGLSRPDPEYLFLLEEKRNALLDSIETRLSSMERKVARLYLEGMTYMDIAKTLGKNEQSVTNALSRSRAKLRD